MPFDWHGLRQRIKRISSGSIGSNGANKKMPKQQKQKKYVWNYQSNQIYYYILLIVYTQFKFQKTKGKALEFMGEQYKKKWHTKTHTTREK